MKNLLLLLLVAGCSTNLNKDPEAIQIVTTDIDNFWKAYEMAKPEFNYPVFQAQYLDPGSPGIEGFMKMRIRSAENLAAIVKSHSQYFAALKASTDSINLFKDDIRNSFRNLKDLYDQSVFPPVYFVIGGMNSGGTTSNDGLIIGAEMYGVHPGASMDEMNDWLRTVLKPVSQVPHIVAHELIHYQQNYRASSLLEQSIKEGSADLIAELISGRHINQHVHNFANPREQELWQEFSARMDDDEYDGWLYSSAEGRPNDLGYWMGYQISRAYYDKAPDKKQAIHDILNISDFHSFLAQSGYPEKFK